jgi:ribonuclease P protein component
VANALAALYVLPSGRRTSRIAVAAGRRLGGAVLRNRHRRRWREVLRRRVGPPEVAVDAVLVSRPRAGSAEFLALERALRDLLARATAPRG